MRIVGRVDVAGTATGYGLDGPGSNPGGNEIFRTCPYRPWGPLSFLYNEYKVFPGGKERPGRDADPSALLVPWSRKSRAIPLLPLWAVRPDRASVPVQYSYTSTPPIGRTACTVQLYLYSPYGPYGLYRASVSVQGCTLSFIFTLRILWNLWTVRLKTGFTLEQNWFNVTAMLRQAVGHIKFRISPLSATNM
jgi:hypothetical protein